jgi:hypothetical protein
MHASACVCVFAENVCFMFLGKRTDRMQDVTFYNVAMKTTNLSLGTLKYLERYHLLPSQGIVQYTMATF